MEHHKTDVRQVADCGASGDDTTRFLRELRQLRDGAGLGHAELAARAHFPYDSIRAAEVGPALPDLPVLSAFVRGCGGTTEEWEERWRSLTSSPSLPLSAARHAGHSDAATAGARIGSVSQVGDGPDPSIILAALDRVAEGMASPAADAAPASPAAPPAPDFPSAPDLPSSAALSPRTAEPFLPEPEPAVGGRPAGWDPIRVSTAWPALPDTPTAAAEPISDVGSAPGAGAPWQAPRTAEPVTAASAAGTARPGGAGAGRAASRTWAVVLAAVLFCVLAVLLAVFA